MKGGGVLLLLSLAVLVAFTQAQAKVHVEAFEMSRCPYCSSWKQSFEKLVMLKEGLPDIINMDENFVGQFNTTTKEYYCLHGPGECVGNTILLCARNLTVSKSQWGWWNLSVCMQSQFRNIPDNAADCAKQQGLDWIAINNCANSDFGAKLLLDTFKFSEGRGVQETPTIFINGTEYVGGPNNPLQVICSAYTGTKPVGCSK